MLREYNSIHFWYILIQRGHEQLDNKFPDLLFDYSDDTFCFLYYRLPLFTLASSPQTALKPPEVALPCRQSLLGPVRYKPPPEFRAPSAKDSSLH
jgi:hypothetical protein